MINNWATTDSAKTQVAPTSNGNDLRAGIRV
jgi:hypothetical protein